MIQNAYDAGPSYTQIRSVVCRVLLGAPDPNNWSEVPNIRDEVLYDIRRCDWFKVYDVAEALWSFIEGTYGYGSAVQYAQAMNDFFIGAGIGWQFAPNEGIVYRGDETFRVATAEAAKTLSGTGRKNAATEIEEAIRDISRRPDPDITGAVSHSMAAVERPGRANQHSGRSAIERGQANWSRPACLHTGPRRMTGRIFEAGHTTAP